MTSQDLTNIVNDTESKKLHWYSDILDPAWICADYLFPGDSYTNQIILEKFSDGFILLDPCQSSFDKPQENYVKFSLENQDDIQTLMTLALENVEP
jgi:hypothetical protein